MWQHPLPLTTRASLDSCLIRSGEFGTPVAMRTVGRPPLWPAPPPGGPAPPRNTVGRPPLLPAPPPGSSVRDPELDDDGINAAACAATGRPPAPASLDFMGTGGVLAVASRGSEDAVPLMATPDGGDLAVASRCSEDALLSAEVSEKRLRLGRTGRVARPELGRLPEANWFMLLDYGGGAEASWKSEGSQKEASGKPEGSCRPLLLTYLV